MVAAIFSKRMTRGNSPEDAGVHLSTTVTPVAKAECLAVPEICCLIGISAMIFSERVERDGNACRAVAQPRIAIAANSFLIPSPVLVHDWQRFEETALIGLDVQVGNSETRRAGRVGSGSSDSRVPFLVPGF